MLRRLTPSRAALRGAVLAVLALAAPSLAATSAAAQAGPPATDIFVAPMRESGGIPAVGRRTPVAVSPGYDNQPAFTPDGRAILYTSIRGDGQSDIYRYDLRAKTTTRVTNTAESEYSAAVMPGGRRFSVVRVERDSTQRLWSFALDGSDPRVVIEDLRPVGYYAWVDSTHVAAFVLGRPNALAAVDLRTGRVDTLARNIGRSIAPLPGAGGFSYVQLRDSTASLVAVRGGSATELVTLPRGAEDVVWLPSGGVLASSGSKIFAWRAGAAAWTEVADLANDGFASVSRMAVSPDGAMLAVVALRNATKRSPGKRNH